MVSKRFPAIPPKTSVLEMTRDKQTTSPLYYPSANALLAFFWADGLRFPKKYSKSIRLYTFALKEAMQFIEILKQPWPWYVAGPLIGLTVPALLIMGNKSFGISSSLRHICASCLPAGIPFFKYDWKSQIWNLVFVAGILVGAILAVVFLPSPAPAQLHSKLTQNLAAYGISTGNSFLPHELFNWNALFTLKGFLLMVAGGFLVGFGTRYAGGCTSGHAITGLSNLQWPSLVATICFMAGGFLMANLLLPILLKL